MYFYDSTTTYPYNFADLMWNYRQRVKGLGPAWRKLLAINQKIVETIRETFYKFVNNRNDKIDVLIKHNILKTKQNQANNESNDYNILYRF